jgi:hypothetical protein
MAYFVQTVKFCSAQAIAGIGPSLAQHAKALRTAPAEPK